MNKPQPAVQAAVGAYQDDRTDADLDHSSSNSRTATPRQQSERRPRLAEPVVIVEFWANRRGESIRIQLREFEGHTILDVRKHYTAADGVLRPTKKGISLAVARLPELANGIDKALIRARDLGLVDGEVGHG
jgi:Transcriptional Coactivator p15 (PC4)